MKQARAITVTKIDRRLDTGLLASPLFLTLALTLILLLICP